MPASGDAAVGLLHPLPVGTQILPAASNAAVDATHAVAFSAATFILICLFATQTPPPSPAEDATEPNKLELSGSQDAIHLAGRHERDAVIGTSLSLLADVALPNISSNLGATAIAFTPSVLIGGATALYLWGAWRVGRADPESPWSVKRTIAFVGAMVLVFVAIETVIGVYDDTLFYDHMIQHILLIMVAAPLIAMGAPVELLVRSTMGGTHRVVTRVLDSRVAEVVGHPITGFVLYTVFIPVAHLTSLYNVMLTNDLAHDNEHLAFLVIGYLFWRPVVAIEPSRHPLSPGLRLIYLMLAVPVDTFCGLVLLSTNHEMFSAYTTMHRTWGPSLVGDLHTGGAIMWVFGDSLMALAMIPVVIQWVRSEEVLTREIDAELDAQEALRQERDGQSTDPHLQP